MGRSAFHFEILGDMSLSGVRFRTGKAQSEHSRSLQAGSLTIFTEQ